MIALQSTLLISKKDYPALKNSNSVQIVHSRRDHWIVSSRASSGVVKVYDSVYNTFFQWNMLVNARRACACLFVTNLPASFQVYMTNIPTCMMFARFSRFPTNEFR